MTRKVRNVSIALGAGVLGAGLLASSLRQSHPAGALPQAVLNAVVEPRLVSSVPWPDLDLQCLMPETALYAASREEALMQRASHGPLNERTIDADRPPVRTIFDHRPTYSAVAVDPIRDEVVLQDENLFQILVYRRGTNTPAQASMAEPKRRIGGLNTKVEFNCGLYVDPASGDIYSVPNDTVDTLVIFGRNAQGDVKPDRELRTPHGTYGIAVDEKGQEMFLTVQHANSVVVYPKSAKGNDKAVREIVGPSTQLEDPHGVAVDSDRNLLFVVNYGNAKARGREGPGSFQHPSITVYPLDANGDAAPLRVIEGENTQLNWPAGMTIDPRSGMLFVANDGGHSVLAFGVTDHGNVAPRRVLKGPKTMLANPTGVAVDLEARELWVSSFGNHSASVFPLDANGDVAPLRTIRAAPKDEKALGIGNPGAVAYDTKREEVLVPN
jgi:6-phosphogluconolactonase (cycloisomerase 2 family)